MSDLRTKRLQAGLTQAELAQRSGVPQPNIAAYERGRRRPSPATIERLEAALRPSAQALVALHRDEIRGVLSRHRMTNPRIFGSVARQQDTAGSDIDLLVDAETGVDLLDIIDAADELEALLGRGVDIVTSRSLRGAHEIARTAVAL
ncbi:MULTISPECIES: helix-turn-helix domain-containing protein [unclassified Luteococcus]|uniref:helix-turn-helix domain-containing protein n=1 Tax=unclassified Luteococcus TaxID=2639923 RepID=UPI00313B478B